MNGTWYRYSAWPKRAPARHKRGRRPEMPLTEWEKAQGMRAPKGAKKQFPVCHLCGREFGTASLKIHLKACAVKYEREKGKPAPPAPDLLNDLTDGDRPVTSADWAAYNDAANTTAQSEMEPCPLCGRTFSAKDRMEIHLRSCKGPAASKSSSRTRRDASPAPPARAPSARAPRPTTSPPAAAASASRPPPQPLSGPPMTVPQTASAAGGHEKASAKERMQELKELLEACLITQDEYDGKRRQIIDSL